MSDSLDCSVAQLMETELTSLPGVMVVRPRIFKDERGFFLESWNQREFDEAVGREVRFVQDNHSRSKRGVLRGLHYQLAPAAQAKLVTVLQGKIFDVAVGTSGPTRKLSEDGLGRSFAGISGLRYGYPRVLPTDFMSSRKLRTFSTRPPRFTPQTTKDASFGMTLN